MDIDDNIDLPVVINKNDELKNINISVAMWVGFIIGMLMELVFVGLRINYRIWFIL